MDEKYLEQLEGSGHVEEGYLDRLRAKAAGAKQFAKNWMGKGTGSQEDAKLNRLFQRFVANALSTIEKMDNALIPLARENRLSQADYDKVLALRKLASHLQAAQKSLKEANPLTQPLSLWGPIGRGDPTEIIDAYRNRISKQFDTFVNDAKKLNLVPDQYLMRKFGSTLPGGFNVLKSLEKVLGRQLSVKPPTAAPEELPAEPTAAPEAPVASTSTPAATAPVPAPTSTPPEPAPAATSTDQPTKTGTATQKPSGGQLDQGTEIAYDLIKQAINKMATVLSDTSEGRPSQDVEKYRANTFIGKAVASYYKHMNKAEHDFPAEPKIVHKVPATADTPETIIRWFLRWRNRAPKQAIEYYGERDIVDAHGNRKTEKADRWDPFMDFNIFDFTEEGPGILKGDFNVLKQISDTNPQLKQVIDTAVPVVGEPENLEQNSQIIAKGLTHMLGKQTPQPHGGERERQAARKPDQDKPPGDAPVDQSEEPEQRTTTTGSVPPEKQGRIGKVSPEPTTEEEPAQVDDKGNITWKGRVYKKNTFKPKPLINQLKKQGILKEISYRDFFSF